MRDLPIAFLAFALVGPSAVVAQEKQHQSDGWILTLGATVSGSPRYEGANIYGPSVFPTFDIRRADEPATFSSPDDGFEIALFGNRRYAIGPVFDFRGGRYRSDTAKLYGLRDVPWTIESGIFAEFWPIEDHLRTRVEVKHGFRGRADGFVGDLSVDWVERIGRLTLSGGPRLSAGDSNYMDANFGVLPTEAIANRMVSPYDAKAGVKAVGAGAALRYDWSQAWATTGYLRYDRLVSNAAGSPIVRRLGSPNQWTLGLQVEFSFAVGR